MQHLARFVRLPRERKMLLARALVTVARVRISLTFRGFKNVELASPAKLASSVHSPQQIANAVARASEFVPGASCLTQAAAAQFLLARYGYTSSIRVGVRHDKAKPFAAHAWLLVDDLVVLGGNEKTLAEYRVLTDLSAGSP